MSRIVKILLNRFINEFHFFIFAVPTFEDARVKAVAKPNHTNWTTISYEDT